MSDEQHGVCDAFAASSNIRPKLNPKPQPAAATSRVSLQLVTSVWSTLVFTTSLRFIEVCMHVLRKMLFWCILAV